MYQRVPKQLFVLFVMGMVGVYALERVNGLRAHFDKFSSKRHYGELLKLVSCLLHARRLQHGVVAE